MTKSRLWLVLAPSLALAAPQGMQVNQGSANLSASGQTTTITTQSQNTALQFTSFDIGVNESVAIQQPGASSRTLCHIPSAQPTHIDGSLGSNGAVYIVNPAGVIFGPTSKINVAGLVAAASNLATSDFMSHIDRFTSTSGPIIFEGAAVAKFIAFIGERVEARGSIITENSIAIASGDEVLLGESGSHVFIAHIRPKGDAPKEGVSVEMGADLKAKRITLGSGDLYSLGIKQTQSSTISADAVDIMAFSTDVDGSIQKQPINLEGNLENVSSLNLDGSEHSLSSVRFSPSKDLVVVAQKVDLPEKLKLRSLNLAVENGISLGVVCVDQTAQLTGKSVFLKGDFQGKSLDVKAESFVAQGAIVAPDSISIRAPWNANGRALALKSQTLHLGNVSGAKSLHLTADHIYAHGNLQAKDVLSIEGFLHAGLAENQSLSATSSIFSSDVDVGAGLTIGSDSTSEIVFRGNVYSSSGQLGDLTLSTQNGGVVLGAKNFGTNDAGDTDLQLGEVLASQTAGSALNAAPSGYFTVVGNVNCRGLTITSSSGHVDLQSDVVTTLSGSDGGDITISAYGSIEVGGDIDASSETLASLPVQGGSGGDVSLTSSSGDVKVYNVVTDGADGSGEGGAAGVITLVPSHDATLSPELTFTPKGRLFLYGSLISAKGGSGPTGYNGTDGIVYLSRTQSDSDPRSQYPGIATICGNQDGRDLVINARDIVANQNEIFTVLGSLSLTASRNIFIGDHIALGDLNLSAAKFYIYRHGSGRILISNGSAITAPSVQAIAGGKITQSGSVFELGSGDRFRAESLDFNEVQSATMLKMLVFENSLLSFDSTLIQSMVPSIAPLLQTPPLAPAYEYEPKLTNTEAAPLTVLAKMIESDLLSVAPQEIAAWRALRDEVLSEKNPIEGPINIYDRKVAFGYFDPNRFVEGLSANTRGKKALTYLQKVSALLDSLKKVKSKKGPWITYLVNRFTKPINISDHNWEDIQTVAVYRETKLKEYQNKKGRISF